MRTLPCTLRILSLLALFLCAGASAVAGDLIINEVAWAGTAAGSSDEWIELYNPSEEMLDLAGWTLVLGDSIVHLGEALEGTIEARTPQVGPGEYLLLERTDDAAVSDISADILYKGSLSNTGLEIRLVNPLGETVDRLPAADGWPAGTSADGDVAYATLERIDPRSIDWIGISNDGIHRSGLDASGQPLNGTPKAENSATFVARHAPRIDLVSDSAAVLRGMIVVTWTATDPDGDDATLQIDFELSPDDGETWETVVSSLTNAGSYAWDTTRHDNASGYRFRIVARDTDGFESTALSAAFAIDNGS